MRPPVGTHPLPLRRKSRSSAAAQHHDDGVRRQVTAELAAQGLALELTDRVAINQLVVLLGNPATWPSTATETPRTQSQNPVAIQGVTGCNGVPSGDIAARSLELESA